MQHFQKHSSFLLFVILIFLYSCADESTIIGVDLQPEADKLKVFFSDTSTLRAYSVPEDSIRTDETTVSMLGSYYDPIFGTTNSSIYTQIRLSTTSVDFGTEPQLDSIVLAFEYTGEYYGDTTTQLTFRVFEIADSLDRDTSYYSNQTKQIIEPEIGSFITAPKPTDSIYVDTIKYRAQFRMHLNDDFGNKLLNSDEANLASGTAFLQFIKGIYVTTDPVSQGGALLYFSLVSNYSRIILYYHNHPDTLKNYNFPIADISARFMNFDHYDYQNADPAFYSQVFDGDTALGSDVLYLQPMAGIKTKIEIPYLRDWVKNQQIAINEAKLVISNYNTESEFEPAPALVLLSIDSLGAGSLMVDYYEGLTYFGGSYDEDNGEYYFRISRYVQNLLKSDTIKDYGLYLVISGASLQANRVLISGYNPSDPTGLAKRMKLKLTYTVL